ncbi:hypothetical protein ACWE42_22305 [Sutcliffiella cohnii]
MKSYFLPSSISKEEAIQSTQTYQRNWITKLQSLFGDKKKLTSIELLYLPYWCFDYEYDSLQIKEPIKGKIAVETVKKLTAILPSNANIKPVKDGLALLPYTGIPDESIALEAMYWEAFTREKKRKNIRVIINESNILYVPYWVGYIEGEKIDIIAVDATSGKVDLGIKDSIITALLEK